MPERSQRGRAQILRSFLKGDAGLLKTRYRRTDHIGKSPNAVGDDKDRKRILERVQCAENFSFLRHRQVAEREDDAGNGQREHGDRVEDVAAGKLRADDNVSDRDTQDEINHRRKAGVLKAVSN